MDFRSEIERFIAESGLRSLSKQAVKISNLKAGIFSALSLTATATALAGILDGHKLRKNSLLPESRSMLEFMRKPVFIELFCVCVAGQSKRRGANVAP